MVRVGYEVLNHTGAIDSLFWRMWFKGVREYQHTLKVSNPSYRREAGGAVEVIPRQISY
jgi:hypothetical protein